MNKIAKMIVVTTIVFSLLMFLGPERPVPLVHAQGPGNTALVVPVCGMQAYMANQLRVVTMDLAGNLCASGTGGSGGGGGVQYPSGTTNATPIGTVALGRSATNVLTPLLTSATGNLIVNQGPPATGVNAWPMAITDTANAIVHTGDAANNAMRVNIVAGGTTGGGGGGTASNFGAAFPTPGTAVGFHNAANQMDYASVDVAHRLSVSIDAVTSTSSIPVTVGADIPCYVLAGVGTSAAVAFANCKPTAGTFKGIRAINTSGTLAYVRMYNLAVAPTCSSATGFQESIPIPASTTGAGVVDILSAFTYNNGVAYCVTGGPGNADNTAPPAGVFITIAYN